MVSRYDSLMFDKVIRQWNLLADRARVASYRKAIHAVVEPGDVVADIGTGSGILAFFAVQAGARKVYAIEQNAIIDDARELAELNGWAEKVVFIEGRSEHVELPEPVDVIISEILGYFGIDEHVFRSSIDARQRFLKPGGKLVPHCLDLYVVPLECHDWWDKCIAIWSQDYFGIDLSAVRTRALAQKYLTSEFMNVLPLAPPSLVCRADLYTVETEQLLFEGCTTVNREGALHGLGAFFEAHLCPGVVISTSPDRPATHWGQALFPLGLDGLRVEPGDEVQHRMQAIPYRGYVCYDWRATVRKKDGAVRECTHSNLPVQAVTKELDAFISAWGRT